MEVVTSAVTSCDGTTIGYRRLGTGPALVILHGMMSSGYHHIELAGCLADTFTVYLPDRRGRGLSGAYRDGHCAQREVEDLTAILDLSGASCVVGVSVGAIIALQTALTVPGIRQLVALEPPFFVPGPAPTTWLDRFDRAIAEGRTASALITAMKASHLGPPGLSLIPRWLLERLTSTMLAREARGASPELVPMDALAPTLHEEGHLVAEMNPGLERFQAVDAEVLLLGGSKSPLYMKRALDELGRVIPNSRRLELSRLGHGASWNAEQRGRPAPVAQELRRFFANRA